MTDYQMAVREHMKYAPQALRDYICERLKKSLVKWQKGRNPILYCDFNWCESEEGAGFWNAVDVQKWQNAMATDFWKEYTKEDVFLLPSLDQSWKRKAKTLRNTTQKPEDYDFVNPDHYKQFSVEVIDMMVAIWGKEATAIHCEMCAFKYRMRMGEKPEQPIERDLEKVNWYLNKAKELRA